MSKRIAIVLFNLGGPDCIEAVKPFLFNLFYDRSIIDLPNPIRWLIAKFISTKREETAKKIYNFIGGRSPILEETKTQASLLKEQIKKMNPSNDYEVFVAMRYWKPFVDEAIQKIKKEKFDEVVLLPLYPHFSTTTSGSSIKEFKDKSKNMGFLLKTVCCYFANKNFVEAHVNLIKKHINESGLKKGIILFSAHGLPESIIRKGDPYQWQIEQCVLRITDDLRLENFDYKICYQSKVGPMKWLSPSTEDELKKVAKQQGDVVVVPISFVSEHSETLVELDIEYKDFFKKNGGNRYLRIPTLKGDKVFIKALAKICLKTLQSDDKQQSCPSSEEGKCPKRFSKCVNNYG